MCVNVEIDTHPTLNARRQGGFAALLTTKDRSSRPSTAAKVTRAKARLTVYQARNAKHFGL
jgi:hypothetical protein